MQATIDIRLDMTARGRNGSVSGMGYVNGMVAAVAAANGVTVSSRKGNLVNVNGDANGVRGFGRYFLADTITDTASAEAARVGGVAAKHPVHAAWHACLRGKLNQATATFEDVVRVLPSLAPKARRSTQDSQSAAA